MLWRRTSDIRVLDMHCTVVTVNLLDDRQPCLYNLLHFTLPSMVYMIDTFVIDTPCHVHELIEADKTHGTHHGSESGNL